MANSDNLQFRFSLTVLNHLGRGLYRSFATVIAEAISNAWDADAECVNIKIEEDTLTIWDDGVGMSYDDVRDKFLKVGYTRRKKYDHSEIKGRHVLGRKGIGKLAYLSISKEIIIITKKDGETISVKIDNDELDKAIDEDKDEQQYTLLGNNADNQDVRISESGTQLVFKGLRKSLLRKNIRRILATQFHFTDALEEGDKFEIRVDGVPIGINDLKDLYENTQFIWFLNEASEKEFMAQIRDVKKEFFRKEILKIDFEPDGNKKEIRGYIASVSKPSKLIVSGSDKNFRASVALFAGGRMREDDIISKISTAQMPEGYLFGQIHVDEMDNEEDDRFTSGRDGVLEDDPLYQDFLKFMKNIANKVMADWDDFRGEIGEDGDPENRSISSIDRKSDALFMGTFGKYNSALRKHPLIKKIRNLARANMSSYIQCFAAENLMRIYINEKDIIKDNSDIKEKINGFKKSEEQARRDGDIPFAIRSEVFDEEYNDLSYLGSLDMAKVIDGQTTKEGKVYFLEQNVEEQRLIRNALMHTATLSQEAKETSNVAWNKIMAKIIKRLDDDDIGDN